MGRKRHSLLGQPTLLGLDEFGQNPGMSPITGALIGGGVAGGTSILIGHVNAFTGQVVNREFWGLLAGLGAAGIMWFSGPSRARHASYGALVGAFLAEGLPWLEKKLLGTVQLPVATAAAAAQTVAAASGTLPAPGTSGVGIAKIHALNGLGIPKISALNGGLGMRRQASGHYLNGLGLHTMQPQPQSVGTIPGVHGPAFAGTQLGNARSPVNLLGNPTAQSQQVSLLGGPQIHGLSAAYGATLLGGGRG
jgi:hypothetical protein